MSLPTPTTLKGYPTDLFLDEVNEDLLCAICLGVTRRPLNLVSCSHLFCSSCIQEWCRDHDSACPVCTVPFTAPLSSLSTIPFVNSMIQQLKIKCTHHDSIPFEPSIREVKDEENAISSSSITTTISLESTPSGTSPAGGCSWIGTLGKDERNWLQHQAECRFEKVTCSDCKAEMQRMYLTNHSEKLCPKRIVKCEFCQESFSHDAIKAHQTAIDRPCTNTSFCPLKCLDSNSKITILPTSSVALSSHHSVCPKRSISCILCTLPHQLPFEQLQSHYDALLLESRESILHQLVQHSEHAMKLETEVEKLRTKLGSRPPSQSSLNDSPITVTSGVVTVPPTPASSASVSSSAPSPQVAARVFGSSVSIFSSHPISGREIHRNVACDHCQQHPIRGERWKCATCFDFDLCGDCYKLKPEVGKHKKTHQMARKAP